jgi:CheY-like chemotaxis protein
MAGEEEKCLQTGMNGYISKPFDPDVLYSKIAAIVN